MLQSFADIYKDTLIFPTLHKCKIKANNLYTKHDYNSVK